MPQSVLVEFVAAMMMVAPPYTFLMRAASAAQFSAESYIIHDASIHRDCTPKARLVVIPSRRVFGNLSKGTFLP